MREQVYNEYDEDDDFQKNMKQKQDKRLDKKQDDERQ